MGVGRIILSFLLLVWAIALVWAYEVEHHQGLKPSGIVLLIALAAFIAALSASWHLFPIIN